LLIENEFVLVFGGIEVGEGLRPKVVEELLLVDDDAKLEEVLSTVVVAVWVAGAYRILNVSDRRRNSERSPTVALLSIPPRTASTFEHKG
jgi:hypothetical protein